MPLGQNTMGHFAAHEIEKSMRKITLTQRRVQTQQRVWHPLQTPSVLAIADSKPHFGVVAPAETGHVLCLSNLESLLQSAEGSHLCPRCCFGHGCDTVQATAPAKTEAPADHLREFGYQVVKSKP